MQHNFSLITNSLAVPTFIIDTNHVVVAWNKACERLTGLLATEVIGKRNAWQGFYKADRPCLADIVLKAQYIADDMYLVFEKSKYSDGLHAEAWFTSLNGKDRYLNCDAEPIYDEAGKLIGVLENLDDVTEKMINKERLIDNSKKLKDSTEQLADANRLLQAILDSIPAGVFWKDLNSNYIGANTIFAVNGGVDKAEDMIGKTDFDLRWHEFAEGYREDDREVIATQQPKLNIIEQCKCADDSVAWVLTNKVPLYNHEKELMGVLGICSDITHIKEMELQLREAKEEAEQASNAKSEFLTAMSHELRTPLNAVLGFSQLLASDDENPLSADQQDSLSYIINSGNHLLELINGLLNLSEIEMSQIDIKLEVINVHNIITEIGKLLSHEATKANVSVIVQPNKTAGLHINADYLKLKQILLNLTSNGIKYNSDDGVVSFSYQQTNSDKVRIEISDTGQGVAEEDFPALFEPFNRLEQADSETLGTGIGLTISKQLVEAMSGEIGVYGNDGKGLTFWVELDQAFA